MLTYHVGVSFLCVELRKVVFTSVNIGKIIQVHRGFVVSEEKNSCVCLINVVVEIAATGNGHRISIKAMKAPALATAKYPQSG